VVSIVTPYVLVKPMEQVEVSRTINAPVQAVWDRYTDHVSWSTWAGLGTVQLERHGTPPPNGVGCVRVFSNLGLKVVYEEVLSFEPPRRMTYRIVRGPVPLKDHHGEVLFEPTESGTRIVWRCQFDSKIPGLGGLFRILVTRMFRNALAGLARTTFSPAPERRDS
jgi:uncharacterized protein YndB with AHSA1/START domain